MKQKLILIAVLAAALLLFGFRYSIVEQEDALPGELRRTFLPRSFTARAGAEEDTKEHDSPELLLERGDSGERVKRVQKRLAELGFLTGGADGHFGAQTEKAVAGFKKHIYQLDQERIAREKAAHDKLIAQAEEAQEALLDEQIPELPAGLYEQEALLNAQIPEPPRPIREQEALLNAQIPEIDRPGTPITKQEPAFSGGVDEITYSLLAEKGFDEYQRTLSSGSTGAEVTRLQNRLRALGYLEGGANGTFGKSTAAAVSDFQKRNKLTQDGIAGERTQRLLFSSAALRQVKKPDKPYVLKISTADQRVYAYGWSEADEAHTKLARTMVCSTGLPDTPTPKGTYTNTSPVVRWGYFPKYEVWAQYLYRIQGPYLFHSVLYDEADESTVRWGSVNKLGSPASHGCIRLSVEDAKWIYENCPAGTTVIVY